MRLRPRAKGLSRVLYLPLEGSRLPSLIFIIISLVLFIASAGGEGRFQGFRSGVTDMAAPVLDIVNRPVQQVASYVRTVTGLASLQAENGRLREENARLREWYQTAQVLKSENESLQALLNITLPPQSRFVTARVIADAGGSYARTLLVLAGKDNNVDKGRAVLAAEGLIGRIVEAGDRTSRVLLLTDINSRVPVMIENTDIRAILGGTNSSRLVLDHLPADGVLTEGTRVMTSGHGGVFPYGLPVGELVRTPEGVWSVQPYSDPDKSTFVRIVENEEDPRLHEASP